MYWKDSVSLWKMYMRISDPCCISLHTSIKICASLSVILGIGVIITSSSLIHSSNRLHNSSLVPLYNILRNEYYGWRAKIDRTWDRVKNDLSTTSSDRIERLLRLHLEFNEEEGLERMMMKEKAIRENLDLPNLPDFPQIEKISYICGLNGLFGGILQLLSSFVLLWTIDRTNKTIIKVWIAVTGGVIFSLVTTLFGIGLQDNSANLDHMSPSSTFLFSLLGSDLLLTIYFLWIILAYLYAPPTPFTQVIRPSKSYLV